MSKKKVIIIVFVILAFLIVGFLFIRGRQATATMASGLPVMVETAKVDTIVTTVNAKGEVSLINSELIYSNIAAEVEEVFVEKNDIVKEGDPLIRYKERSRENIETQLREAELSLQSARLNLDDARTPATETELERARLDVSSTEQDIKSLEFSMEELERDIATQQRKLDDAKRDMESAQKLFNIDALSQIELEEKEKAVTTAEDALAALINQRSQNEQKMASLKETLDYKKLTQDEVENKLSAQSTQNSIAQQEIAVAQRQLQVDKLRRDLADFQQMIYSPISGTITSLSVSKGEITPTDKVLMEISDIDEYVVKIDVNERNAAKVQLGQEVEISGSVLGGEKVSGKVSKIGYIAEEKQTSSGSERAVPVEITIDPSPAADSLKPGFSLEASITTDVRADVIVIPILATLRDGEGNDYVYILNEEDNSLVKRIVEVGAYADMTVEVTGVEVGETVVSQPTLDMYEGMTIMPLSMDMDMNGDMGMEGEGGEEETTDNGEEEETAGDGK